MLEYLSEPIPKILQNYLGPPDYRVKNWFLLNSPLCLIVIMLLYASAIIGGTAFMNNRKPMDLKLPMIIYNAFQVIYSAYVFKEILISAYLGDYHITCSVLDTSTNPVAMRMARAFWLFYLSKVLDLADTVFFVLRKKRSQLSFLHCYHHASMITNWYLGVLYLPGGQAFMSVLLNTFVHVVMYSYYCLSAMGPKLRKYLWWKKYLTQMQLLQFFLVIIHIANGIKNNCKAPRWLAFFTLAYLSTLVMLFANFYHKSYKKQVKTVVEEKEVDQKTDVRAGGDWKYD